MKRILIDDPNKNDVYYAGGNMKKTYFVIVFLIFGFLVLFLIYCQPKEVTSSKVYMEQERWDKAIEQLEEAAQLYPNDAEVYFLLGKAYAHQGRREKMNEMFNKSLSISPKFEQKIKAIREKQ